MQIKIEDQINDVTSGNEVKLKGEIKITMQSNKVFSVGKLCVKKFDLDYLII